jgi:hypothetical protein
VIFVDTSAFYAVHVRTSREHGAAVGVRDRIASGEFGAMVTTNYIFDELLTLLQARAGHAAAVSVGEALRSSDSIELVWLTPKVENVAWGSSGNNRMLASALPIVRASRH